MNMNKKNGQSGAAAVEFALVVPLLLLFLFGIIEFSIILYDKAIVTNASREAAREWIVRRKVVDKLDLSEVQQVARDYGESHLISFGGTGLTITTDPTAASGPIPFSKGDPLRVTVVYQYDFLLLPTLAQSLVPTLDLRAETVMRAE